MPFLFDLGYYFGVNICYQLIYRLYNLRTPHNSVETFMAASLIKLLIQALERPLLDSPKQ